METSRISAVVPADGTLHLTISQHFANQAAEIVLVLQPVQSNAMHGWGYPDDYFARIDAIDADDVMTRAEQGTLDDREPAR